jgi:hypothetical protein
MKKQSLYLITILSLYLFSASCKKDKEDQPGPGGGPNVVLPISGHLVCIGKDSDNHLDTLTFWHSTSGREMVEFYREYLRAADEIRFTVNGNGTVNIRRKEPYVHNSINYDKFGIEENKNPGSSSFPDNSYLWTMYQKDETVLNSFIINRDKNDLYKFTIESKAFPGYFLGVEKWKNATFPTTDRLVFTTKQIVWWFEQR